MDVAQQRPRLLRETTMNQAAQQLGRLGGLAKSKAKAAAVCENGKLGGRPKKSKRSAWRQNAPGERPGQEARELKP